MGMLDFLAGPINWRYQQQENKRQRDWDTAQWNKQNQYNTPANQMARYREAGLNPNLMYGQGSSGNAAPAAQPKYEKATPNFTMMDPQTLAQIELTKAQTENTRADTQLKGGKTNTEAFNTKVMELKAKMEQAKFRDFANTFDLKWSEENNGYIAPQSRGYREAEAKTRGDEAEAKKRQTEAEIQAKALKWVEANNASKYLPLIISILRMAK